MLRGAVDAWWSRERQEGAWATGDGDVREMADKLGMGIGDEGKLRVNARIAVETMKGGFRPSEHF